MESKEIIFSKWDFAGVYTYGDVAIELKKMLPFCSRFAHPESEEKKDFEQKRKSLINRLKDEYSCRK